MKKFVVFPENYKVVYGSSLIISASSSLYFCRRNPRYASFSFLTFVLSSWAGIRTHLYSLEMANTRTSISLDNISSSYEMYMARRSLASFRGTVGVLAAFSAAIFPPPLSLRMVKIFGTSALASIYTEGFLQSYDQDQLIKENEKKNQDKKLCTQTPSVFKRNTKNQLHLALNTSLWILWLTTSKTANTIIVKYRPWLLCLALAQGVFFNHAIQDAQKDQLASYKIKATNDCGLNRAIDKSDQKNVETLIHNSATLRGLIGTIMTVSVFNPIIPLHLLRIGGRVMLLLNFGESFAECQVQVLESEANIDIFA